MEFFSSVSASKTGGNWRQGADAWLHRTGPGQPGREVPSGARWIHEIKFDGYRVQVRLANEAVRVFTRRGNDWTIGFRKIADDAWHIKAGSAIIDGEVVVPSAGGATNFSVLRTSSRAPRPGSY